MREIFHRYENKYLIDDDRCSQLEGMLKDRVVPDQYNRNCDTYSILNLYYDTDDDYLIRNSLSKPSYREKLRLRSYGTPADDHSDVFVEIKKKCGGQGNKRRAAMSLKEAQFFLQTGQQPLWSDSLNRQVLREIRYLITNYSVMPKLFLSYDRRAYFGREDSELRISFDSNIVTRRYDLDLTKGVYGSALLPQGKKLVEIKTKDCMPLWLTDMLSQLEIYPHSFSKYGEEFKLHMQGRKTQGVIVMPQRKAERVPVYKSLASGGN